MVNLRKAGTLTPSVSKVARYIRMDPWKALGQTTYEIANEAQVSPSVVIRLIHELGCSGMQDFRVRLAAELGKAVPSIYEEAADGSPHRTPTQTVLLETAQALVDMADILSDEEVQEAARRILEANRIAIFGAGDSGYVAMDAAHKLQRLGFAAWAYTDSHLQLLCTSALTEEDVAIFISYSGQTTEALEAAKETRRRRARVISLTASRDTSLGGLSDLVLCTPSGDSPDMLGAFIPRLIQLAVIDCLCVAISVKEPDRLTTMLSRAEVLRQHKVPRKGA